MKRSSSVGQESHKLELTPLAKAIRQHRRLMQASLLAVSTAMVASPTPAQSDEGDALILEEVIVTAQKRTQNLQDVPISITVLSANTIKELGIASFEDYALMLPSLSYKSVGPGTATIIMRGASDGGDGNASGSQPSVGLYLDEAPATAIANNLDIHIYDMERIEALAGPQGTLFGASSQSGNLRIITNKPDPSGFYGGFDLGGFGTSGGDPSYSIEGFINMPLSETAAIRLVAWQIEEGGYIDNIAGSRTYQLEGGYGYNATYYPPAPYGRTNTINNDQLVQDDFNELSKAGLRAALRVDLNENWVGNASVIYQDMETDGTWDHDPTNVGDHNIQRYFPDFRNEEFLQAAWGLEGEFGNHRLVYAGAYLDREVQYQSDYTAYGEDAYWVPYYVCDYSATGPDLATQTNTDCTSLEEFYTHDDTWKRNTHELRLQSLGDGRLQYTVGVYYSEIKHVYLQQWHQPGISPNRELGEKAPNVFFRTDQQRKDSQTAVFGELTYDFTDAVSGTLGARFFKNDSDLVGVVGWGPVLFGNADTSVDKTYDDKDQIFKANISWKITDDHMAYATFSEGYRPGGLNRDPGLEAIGKVEYTPDFLTNYEVGFKTTWLDQRLRLNGAVYFMDWEDIQYTIYDFSLSRCCGTTYNLDTAEILGFEVDGTLVASEQWTLFAALSYNDAETTGDFILPNGNLPVPKGTELPNVPEWKGNVSSRYEFNVSDYNAYWQLTYSYSGKSFNEIRPSRRSPQSSYGIANLRFGVDQGDWGIDAWVNNLTDEVAQLYVSARPYEPTTTTNRPRTFGAKYWKRF